MNTVSIKEFQKNIYEYLEKVPLIITKRGIPFLRIEPFTKKGDGIDGRTTEVGKRVLRQPKIVHREVIRQGQEKKGVEVCKHGMMRGVCKFGCK